ncbi:MAG: hypothetical protein B9J98_06050 [Candidatus Terraquivivens tikiterensis]|uniref:Uncharacterized protein n=1 Tax=Candidatus Terraquivivens tikiterensis TaxID=1980982 RepID=A0A2R7Y2D1_9ARCH|nr:MAG: hypothetical protein B9J98_06050 [Candidatus Terraquivivens tikiterensis]
MDGRVVGYEEQEITGIKIKEWNHMIAFDRRRGPDYFPGTTWILGQSFLVWPTIHPGLSGVTEEVLENLLTIYKNYQIWNIVLHGATIIIDLIPVIGKYISIMSKSLLGMLQAMQIISTDPQELIEKLAEAVNPNLFVYTKEWLPFPTTFGLPDVRVSLVDKEFQLQFINQGMQEVIIISIVKLDIPLSFDREVMLYLSPKFEVIG